MSILINNAGYSQCGDFKSVAIEDMKQMIDVNLLPGVLMTKGLMDQMLNRKNGMRSASIFVTSCQVLTPMSGHVVYSSTKKFSDHMSKFLAHENRDKMDVMCY